MGDTQARQDSISGVLASTAATAPNAFLVSPEWRQHLLRWEEGAENAASGSVTPPGTSNFSQSEGREGEESTQQIAQSGPVALQTDDSVCSAQGAQSAPGTVRAEEIRAETAAEPDGDQLSVPWWRDHLPCDVVATLCSAGKVTKVEVVLLAMEITGEHCEALLDSGASRNFISPNLIDWLHLKSICLPSAHCFTLANGESISVDRAVHCLTTVCNGICFTGDYLVGPVPYDLILGLDWLKRQGITWSFTADTLYANVDGSLCQLPALCKPADSAPTRPLAFGPAFFPAEEAYNVLAQQVSQMSAAEATSLLRPSPNRYKGKSKTRARVSIETLVRQAHTDTSATTNARSDHGTIPTSTRTAPHRLYQVATTPKPPLGHPLRWTTPSSIRGFSRTQP